jgi:hypothetical protein
MCLYGGYHGTFNVTIVCHFMKNGVWSPSYRKRVSLTRKQLAELKYEFWKGIRGCMSTDKDEKAGNKS